MYILLIGEGETQLVKMSAADARRAKKLLLDARDQDDEYPEELNDILDKAEIIPFPTIDTSGDNWGWYEDEG